MIGTWTAINLPATQMNKRKDIGFANATQGKNGLSKEIARNNGVNMGVNKGCPGYRRSLGRFPRVGEVSLFLEDVPSRRSADSDSQFLELSNDSAVTPAKVFRGQAKDQPTRSKWSSRPARGPKGFGPTQLPQPLSVSGGQHDVHDLTDIVVHGRAQPK